MSFISSVLSSIETGNPSILPSPASRPSAPAASKPANSSTATSATKPTPQSITPQRSTNNLSAGAKRKAEDSLRRPDKPTANGNDSKPRPKPPSSRPIPVKPAAAAAPSKPPPKGSFADLMAKAKAVQKEAPKVGVLKHQAVQPKEKLSKSEKKRRLEAMAKEKEAARLGKKPGLAGSAAAKSTVKDAAVKRREADGPEYKGTSRPAQPVYKGTAGLPPRRRDGGRDRHRPPRRDEYLATDEEDEGDYYDDYDDYYYSDESSDMEAGIDDVEREEYLALRAAEQEDAEDMRREAEAKKAKMERKQKLAALAKSRR